MTSRALELALAPAYHASTIVRSSPNAVIATTMPTIVNAVRSLCRNAFLATRRVRSMVDRVANVRGANGADRVSDSLNYGLRTTCADGFRAAPALLPAIEPNP